jgi:hypothetical protein
VEKLSCPAPDIRIRTSIQPDLTQVSWMFEVVFDYDETHYEEVDLGPTRSRGLYSSSLRSH